MHVQNTLVMIVNKACYYKYLIGNERCNGQVGVEPASWLMGNDRSLMSVTVLVLCNGPSALPILVFHVVHTPPPIWVPVVQLGEAMAGGVVALGRGGFGSRYILKTT